MGLSLGSLTYWIKYLYFTFLTLSIYNGVGDSLRHWEVIGVSQETLNSPKRKRLTPVSWGHTDSERERNIATGILGPLNSFTKVMNLHIRNTSGRPGPPWESVTTSLLSCHSAPLLGNTQGLSGPLNASIPPLKMKRSSEGSHYCGSTLNSLGLCHLRGSGDLTGPSHTRPTSLSRVPSRCPRGFRALLHPPGLLPNSSRAYWISSP